MKEVITLRNRLESLTRGAQRTFREFAVALPPDERRDAQQVFDECVEGMRSESVEELRRLLAAVERVAAQLTTAMLNSSGLEGVGKTAPAEESGGVVERY